MAAKKKSTRKHTSKTSARKKTATRSKKAAKNTKKAAKKTKKAAKKAVGKKKLTAGTAFLRERQPVDTSEQSGDLQAISRRHGADSESVEELLEEGNAFEANVVTGVEAAENADEQEVHTHEVPEDDVPGEYLDKDL